MSRVLGYLHACNASLQCLIDIGGDGAPESLFGNRSHRTREITLFRCSIADHDDLIEFLDVFHQHHINGGLSFHDDFLCKKTDERKYKHGGRITEGDGVFPVEVSHNPVLRSFFHHVYTGQRRIITARCHDTLHLQLLRHPFNPCRRNNYQVVIQDFVFNTDILQCQVEYVLNGKIAGDHRDDLIFHYFIPVKKPEVRLFFDFLKNKRNRSIFHSQR